MDILKDIPARVSVAHSVDTIVIDIENKSAICYVNIPGERNKHVVVDIVPMLASATDSQKTVIRNFFKGIIAQAVEVDLTNVPELLQ